MFHQPQPPSCRPICGFHCRVQGKKWHPIGNWKWSLWKRKAIITKTSYFKISWLVVSWGCRKQHVPGQLIIQISGKTCYILLLGGLALKTGSLDVLLTRRWHVDMNAYHGYTWLLTCAKQKRRFQKESVSCMRKFLCWILQGILRGSVRV